MKKETLVEIFAEESNFAVIKLPSRNYPGVLIQGDSLGGLLGDVEDAIELFDSDKEEATEALKSLYEELKWRFEAYQKVCQENQIT
jgi:hypothetical protein